MVWLFSISMSRLSHGDMIQNVSAANPCPDYYQATAIMSSTKQRLPKPMRRFVIRGRISQHLYEIDEKYWNKILCVFNSSYTVCTNECLTIIWEREFPLFLRIDVLESHSCTNFDDYDCLFFSQVTIMTFNTGRKCTTRLAPYCICSSLFLEKNNFDFEYKSPVMCYGRESVEGEIISCLLTQEYFVISKGHYWLVQVGRTAENTIHLLSAHAHRTTASAICILSTSW